VYLVWSLFDFEIYHGEVAFVERGEIRKGACVGFDSNLNTQVSDTYLSLPYFSGTAFASQQSR
jgi:hypothetical protein